MFINKAVAGIALSACLGTAYGESNSIVEALKNGSPTVNLRLRYETVDTDGAVGDQDGLILRSAVGYKTDTYKGFSAYVEYENVEAFIEESYIDNQGIADAEMSGVNHAYLKYSSKLFTLTGGRQTIIYDNARHIGNVGWRQNDQTFDALSLKASPIDKLTLNYNYIWEVNRISDLASEDSDHHLFNVNYKASGLANITAYYYLLDFDDDGVGFGNTLDIDTLGIRLTGSQAVSDSKLLYTLEYADQSDGGDNTLSHDASYFLGEVGVAFPVVTVKAGYELIESDNGATSFATPLATVHAFNGWSDRNTPVTLTSTPNGIEDTYISASGKIGKVNVLGAYHMLEADQGTGDIGDEFNLVATYKTKIGPVIGAKAAIYTDDSGADIDTNKFWLWTQYKI